MDTRDGAATFAALRPRLTGIAYRMLGSFAEAEDIVQDAYLRWHRTDRAAVRNPRAFLTRTVARLCLDHLKSARVRRESYIGPWLPEPVLSVAGPETEPWAGKTGDGPDITLTLMMALERLSPLERAAFLLHDVFGLGFGEIARTLDRDAAACRQLCRRARAHVRAARLRFPVSRERGLEIAAAFFRASKSGDVDALGRLLADDVIAYSDGGGKQPAALNPILGRDKVARFYAGLARKFQGETGRLVLDGVSVNGLPGFVTLDPAGVLQVTALAIEDERITTIFIVRNPDKLTRVRDMIGAQPGNDSGSGTALS